MMTLMILFEYIDNGQVTLKDRIPISAKAAAAPPSKIGLAAGSSIKVEDAIYALVTKSANDISVAIAEFMAGSESRFATVMTQHARDIGMDRTLFRNASGLPDPKQVTTARDMARLARYMLMRYPHHYHYFGTKQFTYRGQTYGNHNKLMLSYKGMDGFKTGYINASGFNLVASAKRDGRRLIGVVFGGRTSKSRNDHMAEILDDAFSKIKDVNVAGIPDGTEKPVVPGRKPGTAISPEALALASNAEASAVARAAKAAGQQTTPSSFTSLSSLQTTHTLAIPPDQQKQQAAADIARSEAVNTSLESGVFSELIGQGDYDPAVSKRIETGLLAVAVHKGDYKPNPKPSTPVEKSLREVGHAMFSQMTPTQQLPTPPSAPTPASVNPSDWKEIYSGDAWSIQIGAYNSRVATDRALRKAQARLPQDLSSAKPVAVPLRTSEGMMFRARLSGLNKKDAQRACTFFKDCLTIAPQTQAQ
jgi:D-alanyl-D-alanine carboxypeptidase